MIRTVAAGTAALLIIGGSGLLSGPVARADPPALCHYQLGDKTVTVACDADPQAEPGMAGNMPGDRGPGSAIARFEEEQQEVLEGQYQDGWYPGCNTTPMC